MATLVVRRVEGRNAATFAQASSCFEPEDGDAELLIGSPADNAIVSGAFERRERGRVRRGSGGAALTVGPGTIWMTLRLARADILVPCDGPRLMNRYVRPLLKALGRCGAQAAYFDRDWFAVDHRPAGMVAFGHEARSGACTFEAFVAVTTAFAFVQRASYRGKQPGALDTLAGVTDVPRIVDAIIAAYGEGHDVREAPLGETTTVAGSGEDPPWLATVEEAIGELGATKTRFGGELMASRDAVARLEREMATTDDVGALVDATFTAPNVVVYGVRSLKSIRDVILRARESPRLRGDDGQ